MAIPSPADADIAEIENLSNAIRGKLTIMRHAGKAPRDFAGLRDVLQEYVDRVMEFARSTER
jgi:hypothetical protein